VSVADLIPVAVAALVAPTPERKTVKAEVTEA